jgi:hypothetical protein
LTIKPIGKVEENGRGRVEWNSKMKERMMDGKKWELGRKGRG